MSENKTIVGEKNLEFQMSFRMRYVCKRRGQEVEAAMRMNFPHRFAEIMWGDVRFPTKHRVGFKKTATSFKYHTALINRREVKTSS